MAQPAVGAGLDEFVILAEGGLVAPLLAQMTGGSPGQCDGWRAENHGSDQRRCGLLKADRTHIGPGKREADHDQANAPAGGRRAGYFFLSCGLLAGLDESQRPDKPAQAEFDVGGDLQHGNDCIPEWLGGWMKEKIIRLPVPVQRPPEALTIWN